MIRTEEEARKCWCPFGLTPHYARDTDIATAVAANRAEQSFEDDIMGRPESPLPTCACIASECMAWRWTTIVDDRPRELWSKHHGIRVTATTTDDADWRLENPAAHPLAKQGYCGLAGKP